MGRSLGVFGSKQQRKSSCQDCGEMASRTRKLGVIQAGKDAVGQHLGRLERGQSSLPKSE